MITYSTSTETAATRNRVAIARVAAAGRITAERKAAEKRHAARAADAKQYRARIDRLAAAAGAVTAHVKVCLSDGPKLRSTGTVAQAHDRVEFYDSRGEYDVEVTYFDANGDVIDHELVCVAA